MAQYLYCMADNKIWYPTLNYDGKPLYLQLVASMAEAIDKGELCPGDKLPPQRHIAWHLDINLSTVTKAFQQAAKQHLITGEVGRGTYVLGKSTEAELFRLKAAQRLPLIDLSTHIPARKPRDRDLDKTLQSITQSPQGMGEYLDYLAPRQLERIQQNASRWLNELGYASRPEQCVVSSCAHSALTNVLLAHGGKDSVVLVSEFTFPGMKAIAKQLGIKLHGVKMDTQGLCPESLDLAIRSTGSTLLVADTQLHNPTGRITSIQRETDLVKVIKKHGILLVEEFVIGALSERPPISRKLAQQSIIITSLAKSVAPGLRFAMMAGQHPLIEKIRQDTHANSWQLSPLMAEVACRWIENGTAQRRRKWQIKEIEQRFGLFQTVFSLAKQRHSISAPHLWLKTKGDAEHAQASLQQQGLVVVASNLFAVGLRENQYIRVSLTAAKTRSELRQALTLLRNSNLIDASELR